MKNRNKLIGIVVLLAAIVFAMTSCAPKKSEAEKAAEERIAALEQQLAALNQQGGAAETAVQAAELQAELETAQAGLETTQRERRERGNRGDRQGGRNQQAAAQTQTPASGTAPAPFKDASDAGATPSTGGSASTQTASQPNASAQAAAASPPSASNPVAYAAYTARTAEGDVNASQPNNPAERIYQAVLNDRTGNPAQAAYDARVAEGGFNRNQANNPADRMYQAVAAARLSAPAGTNVKYTSTSVGDLRNWLAMQPANTPDNPYTVALNVNNLEGTDNMLYEIRDRYFHFDLSGSTFWTTNSLGSGGRNSLSSASIMSLTLPASVTSLGGGGIGGYSMTAINVAAGNPAFISVDGVLFSKDKTELIAYPGARKGPYTIPNGVTRIGQSAFFSTILNEKNLTGITIPNSVTLIADAAFVGCKGFTSVTIPNSVTLIAAMAFKGSGLTSVTIPDRITEIGSSAFQECADLASVTIGKSVAKIEKDAFAYTGSLATIHVDAANASFCTVDGVLYNKEKTRLIKYPDKKPGTSFAIPEGVIWILRSSVGSSNLTSVTLPSTVITIEDYAFNGCTNLTSVTFLGYIEAFDSAAFPVIGDLRAKYMAQRGQTYTRPSGGNVWTKQ